MAEAALLQWADAVRSEAELDAGDLQPGSGPRSALEDPKDLLRPMSRRILSPNVEGEAPIDLVAAEHEAEYARPARRRPEPRPAQRAKARIRLVVDDRGGAGNIH